MWKGADQLMKIDAKGGKSITFGGDLSTPGKRGKKAWDGGGPPIEKAFITLKRRGGGLPENPGKGHGRARKREESFLNIPRGKKRE